MTKQSDHYANAVSILKENDRGNYTVPTAGLYPFQWNWDSCLTALGFLAFDEARAWQEIETLLEHQWADGMVPHIVFHVNDDGYFPGPDVWQTKQAVPTSGITQPPIAGFVLRQLFERSENRKLAEEKAQLLLPKIGRWHDWFYQYRDPANEGLVSILHPWESGRDNSIDWDTPLSQVPTDGISPYERRDLLHADASHRPTKEQYDRYLSLVELFRKLEWDNARLIEASPFNVIDPGFNAILIRSSIDLSKVAAALGQSNIADAHKKRADMALHAMDDLWSDDAGQYLCHDRISKKPIDSQSVGGLLPILAPVPKVRAEKIAQKIQELSVDAHFIVPSHNPQDQRFDGRRYWRGPSWLIINYLLYQGFMKNSPEVAATIRKSSLELIERSGFAEYYDPHNGTPCGGGHFTWTAAMAIEFLKEEPVPVF